jgi:hypothetical protein
MFGGVQRTARPTEAGRARHSVRAAAFNRENF